MKKILYLIPTMKCNLKCSHCTLYDNNELYNEKKFIEKMNTFNGELILFGGEPTSNIDRLFNIININEKEGISKISSISTNLIILNEDLLNFYKKLNGIATSWNPNRFPNKVLYQKWLNNLKIINDNNISHKILITLTKDLLDINIDDFLKIIREFLFKNSIIEFEPYIGDDVDNIHYINSDAWLCNLYKKWNLDTYFTIKDKICNWYYECSNIYTLYPDGNLYHRCPHDNKFVVPDECFKCERVSICKPCRLIPFCSYPRQLYSLIYNEKKK